MADRPSWALVVHGGAGVISRERLSAEQDAAYRDALTTATAAGAAVRRPGGSSMNAIEAAIPLLEDAPLFNAGRGATFTAEGRNELDASIMDGATLAGGAGAGPSATRRTRSGARAGCAG